MTNKYIIIKIVGDFTAKEMMTCVAESHSQGRSMGVRRYLVDVTEARNVDSAQGNYEFAYIDMKQNENADPHARVAALISPGDHSHDFAATTSTNAGMSLTLFTDLGDAVSYLLQ